MVFLSTGWLLTALWPLAALNAQAPARQSAEEFLGRPVATDFRLASGTPMAYRPTTSPVGRCRSSSHSRPWRLPEKPTHEIEPLLVYPATNILLSGWARDAEALSGTAAWVRARVGKGSVHLFGFRPQYRSWTQTTFPLLFRAILLDVD